MKWQAVVNAQVDNSPTSIFALFFSMDECYIVDFRRLSVVYCFKRPTPAPKFFDPLDWATFLLPRWNGLLDGFGAIFYRFQNIPVVNFNGSFPYPIQYNYRCRTDHCRWGMQGDNLVISGRCVEKIVSLSVPGFKPKDAKIMYASFHVKGAVLSLMFWDGTGVLVFKKHHFS